MDSTYIATWDLVTNLEYSMLQLDNIESSTPENFVCKGVKEKYNYIISEDGFYDL